MKMLYGCPFEKKEKEVFFRLTTFFSGTKNFCSRNNFCSVFYVLESKKKFRSNPKIFLKLPSKFSKKNFFGSLRNFIMPHPSLRIFEWCGINVIFHISDTCKNCNLGLQFFHQCIPHMGNYI